MDDSIAIDRRGPSRASWAAVARVRELLEPRAGATWWVLPAQLGVIALAAAVYLYNVTGSGYANTYYSMAAQAASQSWPAWFFGSLDAANFITLDKPPLATMVMGLSVRLFGLSSWSILLPQALAGVGAVALLFAMVRRQFGPAAPSSDASHIESWVKENGTVVEEVGAGTLYDLSPGTGPV